MAKTKDKQQQEEREPTILDLTDRICKEVDKDYGEGVIVDGNSVVSKPATVIPISPALDIITSGGIEEGCWVGITGNPKTGKTTMALSMAANAQRPEYGARPVYYIKAEGRLSVTHLKGIKGLDLSPGKFHVVQSREGRILSAQDFLRITGTIIRSVPGACIIIDSASALCDENELNSDIGDQQIASGNKLFSKFVRVNAQVVPVNRTVMLVITHLISNIGRPGYSERAARAMQYQYDYMLRTITKTAWKAGDRQIGLVIKWACNTSRLGPPGMLMESYLRFGVGVDRLYEAVSLGIATGLISGKGWYTLSFLAKPEHQTLFEGSDPPKFQGGEKLYQALLAHPEWAAALEKEVLAIAGALAGSGGDE